MIFHLRNHCIEAAAKQERRRVVSALLELDEASQDFRRLGDDLELLTSFLENTDFRRLRAERPELAGGCDIHVELVGDLETGRFELSAVTAPRAEPPQGSGGSG